MNFKCLGRSRAALSRTGFAALLVLSAIGTFGAAIPTAHAQSIQTGVVTITAMGCNMVSGTAGTACWVNISGPAVGPSGCSGTSIRWDATQSPNGQVALAQLTAAFAAGDSVSFDLQNSCWSEWPAYPTIYYYEIYAP